MTSASYSAIFMVGPIDSVYAILAPAATIGFVETEQEVTLIQDDKSYEKFATVKTT